MEKEKSYTAEQIFALNQTEQIKRSKAKDIGGNFYHYTRVDCIDKILSGDERGNSFFYVRNMSEMNDANEAKWHESDGNRIHSFCTCCTKHEKIPLWYLYSGITGRGARLGITPGKMLMLINSIETIYPVEDDKVDYSHPLKINEDFELSCGWVYYLMDGNNRVKYRNKFYPVETMDEETIKTNYFIKNYPWEYECEFRIVIVNKSKETFERIALPLSKELMSGFDVTFAPEYEFSEEKKKKYVLLGIKSQKIKKSKLKIKMKLLYNNRKQITEEIDTWCDETQYSTVCDYIKTKRGQKKCSEICKTSNC